MPKRNPLSSAICPGCGAIYNIREMRLNRKLAKNRGAFCCLTCDYEIADAPCRLWTIGEMLAGKGTPEAGRGDTWNDVDLPRYTRVLVGLLSEVGRGVEE